MTAIDENIEAGNFSIDFVGAGPGDVELLTLRAARLLRSSQVLLYAGSLVPSQVTDLAENAEKHDTSGMVLPQMVELMAARAKAGFRVVRLHSGDPSIYGALAEQVSALRDLGISVRLTAGVSAYAAAAARLGMELTLPEISQTIILTRTSVRASAMPANESLAELGRSGATLVIHLSINNLAHVCRTLSPLYGEDCPIIIAYRVGWEDELFLHGTISDIRPKVKRAKLTRTALIFVGRVFSEQAQAAAMFSASKLYDAKHSHIFRELSCEENG